MINQVWQWYQASGLSHATITIPGIEGVILLVILTMCMLFRITRTGLVIAYIFTYRWGLLFGEQYFAGDARLHSVFFTSYIVFGILVLTLATVAMMLAARSDRQE